MDPFLGEVKMFSFPFVPAGYAACDGAIMQITQNAALYSLIGIYYGGDGKATFALPDLRGRLPMNFSTANPFPAPVPNVVRMGEKAGAEGVALTATQVPAHTHQAYGAAVASNKSALKGNLLAEPTGGINIYAPANSPTTALNSGSITPTGGSAAHNNMQPYLVVNFCIAISNALYPPRQ